MPKDTCSITRNCVWRASQHLADRGHGLLPSDLCIGITASGEPCARKASKWLGNNPAAEDHALDDEPISGQPFCDLHASFIVAGVLNQAIDANPAEIVSHANRRHKEQQGSTNDRSVVYFARHASQVKIGVTINPDSRIRVLEMTAGRPFDEVRIVKGDRSLEAKYHKTFDQYRLIGEWFEMSPEIRAVMDTLTICAPI